MLDELRPSPTRPSRDEQSELMVMETRDGVVAPRVVAHVQSGELPWRPVVDVSVHVECHVPDTGGEAALGDQDGVVLALR